MGNCCRPAPPPDGDDTSVAGTTTSEGTQVSLSKGKHKKTHSKLQQSHSFMSRLAMKFPKIRTSFRLCKEVFDKHAAGRGFVPKREIKPILIALGAKEEDLDDSEIDRLVATANLDGDDKIDFKEFLIAAAVGVFLKADVDESKCTEDFRRTREGFAVVKDAFDHIDEDASGEIDFEELKSAFLSMRQDDLIQQRLAELDITGDSQVRFPEFVFGMCSWVGMEEDEDDPDMDDLELLSPQVNNTHDFPAPDEPEEAAQAGDSQRALVGGDEQ